jgi:lysozyme
MSIISAAVEPLVNLLRVEEGLRLKPYLCQAGVPTIGIGATTYPDGRRVSLTDPPITEETALTMARQEARNYLQKVLEAVNNEATINQLVAMTSLAYNIGVAGFKGSTVCKAHKEGDFLAAARAFMLWNKYRPSKKAPLRESSGLTARRLRESALYVTPDDEEALAPRMPQAVVRESSLAASPINIAGATTVAAGGVTGVTSLIDGASPMLQKTREMADSVNVDVSVVLGIVLVVAGAVAVYNRFKQRNGGWA